MEKILKGIMSIVKVAVALLLTGTVVCGTLQIFTRYVLGNSLSWTEQLTRFLFIWLVALGIPLSFYDGGSFKFDILIQKFVGNKPKLELITDIIVWIAIIAFSTYYFYWSLQLVIKAGAKTSAGIAIPYYFLYGAQPVSAFLLLCITITDMVKKLKARKADSVE